jgi:DNA-binding transcriptional regulator GbsR (MarR family)
MAPPPAIADTHHHFVQGISRIAHFWGFPKAMGAAYAAVYLSPEPLSLDEIVAAVGVTKGGLSGHLRMLERLGVVQRESRPGDRKDYYTADTDFWGVVRRILREREKREFDRALRSIDECVRRLDAAVVRTKEDAAAIGFYKERLATMKRFFDGLDRIVAALVAMDHFQDGVLAKWFGMRRTKKRTKP